MDKSWWVILAVVALLAGVGFFFYQVLDSQFVTTFANKSIIELKVGEAFLLLIVIAIVSRN